MVGTGTRSIQPWFDGHANFGRSGKQTIDATENLSVEEYLSLVRDCLEYRRPYAQLWQENEALYDADPKIGDKSRSGGKLGRAYGIVQTIASTVFNEHPKITVDSVIGQEMLAKLFEALVNNDWTYNGDHSKEISICAIDQPIYGISVAFSTYDADFAKVERKQATRIKDIDSAILAGTAGERAQMVAEKLEQEHQHADLKEFTYENDWRVVEEEVCTRRLSPWDFLCDYKAPYAALSWWKARRLQMPVSALKASPFDNVEKCKADNGKEYDGYWPSYKVNSKVAPGTQADEGWFTAFEIWDFRSNRLVVVAPGVDGFLRDTEIPYYKDPFDVMSWNNRGEGVYVVPDLSVVRDLILEEEGLRVKLRDSFEREAIDVYLVPQGLGLGEQSIVALTAPDGSKFIPITVTAGTNIQQVLYKLPRDQKSPDILNHLMRVASDIQEALGLGPNQMGSPLKSSTTASEAMEIAGFAKTKMEFKYRSMELFAGGIGFTRLCHTCQFFDEEQVFDAAGIDAAAAWAGLSFTPGDIQNRFSVRVEEGSMAPQNDQMRQANYLKLLSYIIQVPDLAQGLDMRLLILLLLDTMGIKSSSSLFLKNSGNDFAKLMMDFALRQSAPAGPEQALGGGGSSSPAGPTQAGLGSILGAGAGSAEGGAQ